VDRLTASPREAKLVEASTETQENWGVVEGEVKLVEAGFSQGFSQSICFSFVRKAQRPTGETAGMGTCHPAPADREEVM
jgi:hypothetical protein